MPLAFTVACADIGSVEKNKFGWCVKHRNGRVNKGSDILELADIIKVLLNNKKRVALGFESPLFTPFRREPIKLLNARNGEKIRNWIGGPGSSVLATGIVQVTWLLREILPSLKSDRVAYLKWNDFRKANNGLFLWEAYVVGKDKDKSGSHIEDAHIAVEAFLRSLPDPIQYNMITESSVISLVGMALVRSGWSKNSQLLSQSCLVIKP